MILSHVVGIMFIYAQYVTTVFYVSQIKIDFTEKKRFKQKEGLKERIFERNVV